MAISAGKVVKRETARKMPMLNFIALATLSPVLPRALMKPSANLCRPAQSVKTVHRRQIVGLKHHMSASKTAGSLLMVRAVRSLLVWPILLATPLSACTYFGGDEKSGNIDGAISPPPRAAMSRVMSFIATAAPGARSEFDLPALGGLAYIEVGAPYDSAARLVCKRVNISPVGRSSPVRTVVACDEGGVWTVKGEDSKLLEQ